MEWFIDKAKMESKGIEPKNYSQLNVWQQWTINFARSGAKTGEKVGGQGGKELQKSKREKFLNHNTIS